MINPSIIAIPPTITLQQLEEDFKLFAEVLNNNGYIKIGSDGHLKRVSMFESFKESIGYLWNQNQIDLRNPQLIEYQIILLTDLYKKQNKSQHDSIKQIFNNLIKESTEKASFEEKHKELNHLSNNESQVNSAELFIVNHPEIRKWIPSINEDKQQSELSLQERTHPSSDKELSTPIKKESNQEDFKTRSELLEEISTTESLKKPEKTKRFKPLRRLRDINEDPSVSRSWIKKLGIFALLIAGAGITANQYISKTSSEGIVNRPDCLAMSDQWQFCPTTFPFVDINQPKWEFPLFNSDEIFETPNQPPEKEQTLFSSSSEGLKSGKKQLFTSDEIFETPNQPPEKEQTLFSSSSEALKSGEKQFIVKGKNLFVDKNGVVIDQFGKIWEACEDGVWRHTIFKEEKHRGITRPKDFKAFFDYKGQINLEGSMDGVGVCIWEGDGKDGERQLYLYEGQFKENARSGIGSLYAAPNSVYNELLYASPISTKGKLIYEGSFENNLFEGEGKEYYKNNDYYNYNNNCYYKGEFAKGEKKGEGIVSFGSDFSLEGNFFDQKIKGKLSKNNQILLQGEFILDAAGKLIVKNSNGIPISIILKNGKVEGSDQFQNSYDLDANNQWTFKLKPKNEFIKYSGGLYVGETTQSSSDLPNREGQGKFQFYNGLTLRGTWKENQFSWGYISKFDQDFGELSFNEEDNSFTFHRMSSDSRSYLPLMDGKKFFLNEDGEIRDEQGNIWDISESGRWGLKE